MKKILLTLITLISVLYINVSAGILNPADSIKIYCSPELYSLTSGWSQAFNMASPGKSLSVTQLTGKADPIPGNSVAILRGGPTGSADNNWRMVVGKDVFIAVYNTENPLAGKIRDKGISPENLAKFFNNAGSLGWGVLLGTDDNEKAACHMVDDVSLIRSLSGYIGTEIQPARSGGETPGELISAVNKDPLAIGFCKMATLTGPQPGSKLAIIPVDRNNDGLIDHNEDFCQDLASFERGVWIGKYPHALTSNIYAVASGNAGADEVAFLKWIITDGQSYIEKAGFTSLLAGERQSGVDRIAELMNPAPGSSTPHSVFLILLAILVIIASVILLSGYFSRSTGKVRTDVMTKPQARSALTEGSLDFPGGLLFDRTHIWSYMEQSGTVKVGLDDFLQHITGKITRLVMKDKGDFVRKGDALVTIIRNGKHLILYSPISGIIKEKNKMLQENVALLNTSPYQEGWIYRIEPLSWTAENSLLIMAVKYRQVIGSEILRLKEFLAGLRNNENPRFATIVLQDGGELIDNPLADLGPEIWEEFQIKFIDNAKIH